MQTKVKIQIPKCKMTDLDLIQEMIDDVKFLKPVDYVVPEAALRFEQLESIIIDILEFMKKYEKASN